ncbi:MAG: IMP cyclohydrolase [Clostridia bacterium]|nr:IMP cyclohydrolase [Clostridia bacterium]
MENIFELLKQNTYPGRGIILGKSVDGKKAVVAYFIMGRSENSKNRIFAKTKNGIKTQAFDESKLEDPSLIIYNPVIKYKNKLIVTNGDQTDTIYKFLKSKKGGFKEALDTRTYEPDFPNCTPRISGIVKIDEDFSYTLSILKSDEGDKDSVLRFLFDYENPRAGQGEFISTYVCDGNPLPSFVGEPIKIKISEDEKAFAENLWESLNPDNKVSLYVNFIDLKTGKEDVKIFNKNQ